MSFIHAILGNEKKLKYIFTRVKYSIQLHICNLNGFGKIRENICMTKVAHVASVWQMQEKWAF